MLKISLDVAGLMQRNESRNHKYENDWYALEESVLINLLLDIWIGMDYSIILILNGSDCFYLYLLVKMKWLYGLNKSGLTSQII